MQYEVSEMSMLDNIDAPGRPGLAVVANRDDAISTEVGDILRS